LAKPKSPFSEKSKPHRSGVGSNGLPHSTYCFESMLGGDTRANRRSTVDLTLFQRFGIVGHKKNKGRNRCVRSMRGRIQTGIGLSIVRSALGGIPPASS